VCVCVLSNKRWGGFHGARTSDAHTAATAVRRALGPDQVLVGVGYSMGAIILNNYVATSGPDCALDGAIAISGGLDMRYQEHFYRAQRLWQPMLAETLRNDFLLGKWGLRVKERLSNYEMLRMLRASHVTVSVFLVLYCAVFSCLDSLMISFCFSRIFHATGDRCICGSSHEWF
jgi:predicted alpha/beta-fold hydrolase